MNQQQNPNSSPKVKIIWLSIFVALVSIIITFLTAYLSYDSMLADNKQKIKELENKIEELKISSEQAQKQILDQFKQPSNQEKTDEEYTFPKQDKVFSLNNKSLYYQMNNTNRSVDVYFFLEKDNMTLKIINDVPIGLAGGSMPEFLPTSDPSITLLWTTDGDLGWRYKNYYFINTDDEEAITIKTNNQPSIEVIDIEDVKSKIGISIQDKCESFTQDSMVCKNSGNAYLDDLTLNDKRAGILKKQKTLSCFNPDGLGGCYNENIQIEYKGITKDLSKVYFSFIGKTGYSEKSTVLWDEHYSFDIKSKEIKIEEPNNLLD